jgi:hemerythrin-like domain-containing protein
MESPPDLAAFQADHERFVELFVIFQCALMNLDVSGARLALDLVIYEVGVHADVEDGVLMPIFKARAGRIEGGAPELFEAEHDKIGRLLGDLSRRLVVLERARRVEPREALELIESGFTFKHLWDHHTKRENAAFYPVLDRLMEGEVGSEERARVWASMDAVERASRTRRGGPPPPYRVV